MIDRYLLRYFLAVVDRGNFSRAAVHCGVSQPTLSVGIAKLEALLGAPLFLRSNRRTELTPAGTRLAVHARRIELEFAQAEHAVGREPPTRLIRLGVASTLPTAMIERALAAARAAAPGERIEMVEGRDRDLRQHLDRGRIDAVLGPLGGGTTVRQPLFEESYAMALPADHALAGRASIGAVEVAHEPMIVRQQCEVLAETSRHFTAQGIRPFMAARTTSDDRAVAYVRAGLGITVLPRCFAGAGLAMVPLAGFDLRRTIGITIDPAGLRRVEAANGWQPLCDAMRGHASSGGTGPRRPLHRDADGR